jgi:gliding motility-associated protein GldE
MEIIIGIAAVIVLLFFSALISGSEVAYFSLTGTHKQALLEKNTKSAKVALELLRNPEKLLATILVANNFINVAIIIISTYITQPLLIAIESTALQFIIQIVVLTFLLLLFGELMPKVYANQFSMKHALRMALPLRFADRVFSPLSYILTSSTNLINKRLKKRHQNLSMDELSHAIEMASEDLSEEKTMLEGIVKFSNIQVREIMRPRVDVVALDIKYNLDKVISVIVDSGYSRIPVYEGNFDHIKGILYIKDLLPYLKVKDKSSFSWQKLIREHYFVPEFKKISELLEEFQQKKIHMAIVIDEYGGSSGLVTMEDILEEIVGEISDESDNEDLPYRQQKNDIWEFTASVSLNDFCKIMQCDFDIFNEIRGDADSLAGLILEILGEMPSTDEIIQFAGFKFKVTSVDNRRIKTIEVKKINEKK